MYPVLKRIIPMKLQRNNIGIKPVEGKVDFKGQFTLFIVTPQFAVGIILFYMEEESLVQTMHFIYIIRVTKYQVKTILKLEPIIRDLD